MNTNEQVVRIVKGEFYAKSPSPTGVGMVETDENGHLCYYAWLPSNYTQNEKLAFEQGISEYSILPTSIANFTTWKFGRPCRLTLESSWCHALSTSEKFQDLVEYNGLNYVLMDNRGVVLKCGILGLDKVFCKTFMLNYSKQLSERWNENNHYIECSKIERMNVQQIASRSLSFRTKFNQKD